MCIPFHTYTCIYNQIIQAYKLAEEKGLDFDSSMVPNLDPVHLKMTYMARAHEAQQRDDCSDTATQIGTPILHSPSFSWLPWPSDSSSTLVGTRSSKGFDPIESKEEELDTPTIEGNRSSMSFDSSSEEAKTGSTVGLLDTPRSPYQEEFQAL